MAELACSRTVPAGVEEVLEQLGAELRHRGFGNMATLRLHETLHEELGATIEPLIILDVGSPKHAQTALAITRDAALLLPCKVVLSAEGPATRVLLRRPEASIRALLPDPRLIELDPEVLSAEAVARLYAMRWKIELLFKKLKSSYALDELRTTKAVTVEALIWSALLTLVVSRRLHNLNRTRAAPELRPRDT